jgi:hypothetical protein
MVSKNAVTHFKAMLTYFFSRLTSAHMFCNQQPENITNNNRNGRMFGFQYEAQTKVSAC